MDKTYDPTLAEDNIYRMWEKGGYFTPKMPDKKALPAGRRAFSILLPLPNANDPMHMGHAMFVIQDIMIRYHRMLGDPTLWLPGGDHAGIETQFVFEKKLAKSGKSRFDFDRETLYRMIESFVEENKNINRNQMKRLGFSLDWTRYHYSLEPEIISIVLTTFRNMHADGLIYRDERLVNYCTKCGTSFSDLEIKHVEQIDPLYYMKYGPFVLATVRPETKFGDTAVAVHPKDKRYLRWVDKEIEVEGLIGKFTVKVIADSAIDPKFGTGVAKVTPAHDMTDFEIGKRHNLAIKQVIGFDGRLADAAGPYAGLKVKAAREKVATDLQTRGLIDHIDNNYTHTVGICYKCNTVLEPLPIPQWYVKTKPLAKPAIAAVKEGKTKIVPLKRFEKLYFRWLENITDWNISRQIVWGPRIPAWYCLDCNPTIRLTFLDKQGNKINGLYKDLQDRYSFEEIAKGLQNLMAPISATYTLYSRSCKTCRGSHVVQETDTFDTWFLSSQWPVTTLQVDNKKDFSYFYPTSVLDTMWDILFFWVARMMMMGLYKTGEVPFEAVHIHSRVVDAHGQKMSKSRGNVMDPIALVEKFGADALRFALVFGAAPGGDIAISEDKVRGMRNFANKLWNMARFIEMNIQTSQKFNFFENKNFESLQNNEEKQIINDLNKLTAHVTKCLDTYRFSDAAQALYDFAWHRVADVYLEKNKERFKMNEDQSLTVLLHVFHRILKLLHPFMPFITEELWNALPRKYDKPLIISSWPS
ncbi:valine--tRNA ligase [Patescibacteria group bacterium]|nr:valine--tRNA ligase [Patescibacteria group bacterium]MBU1472859.1 valine--tRNA ligase [Patescibacteria group bacterium]MBU2459516.1 valine--tRNA ligase [Patescibacteria group bacterium]MBU2543965.1 valine--tRNA ligase [Patescibacteria group bacterium]